MRYQRHRTAVLMSFLGVLGCSGSGVEDPSASVGAIVHGTEPPQGSQRATGVVRFVDGCSGTLITNQHVLTNRHCVREWLDSGAWGATKLGGAVRLETTDYLNPLEAAALAIEWEPSVATAEPDIAVLRLDRPLAVNQAENDHFKPIYAGDPYALLGQTLTCRGYGFGYFATQTTYAWGSGVLRMADMIVDNVNSASVQFVPNALGQIHMGGDSGSSCTLGNEIATVVWRGDGTGTDINGDGKVGNGEFSAVQRSFGVNPAIFRDVVASVIHSDLEMTFGYAAQGSSEWPAEMMLRFTTPEHTVDLASYWAETFEPVRSNFVEVTVMNEPPNTMCGVSRTTAPMDGSAVVHMNCLDDGLLPVLF